MKPVLLILSSTRFYNKGLERAFQLAKDAKVIVLFVLDEAGTKKMSGSLRNLSFIGLRPEGQVTNLIRDEYRMQGIRVLTEIEQLARDRGLACDTRMTHGRFANECVAAATALGPASTIISRSQRSPMSAHLVGTALEELQYRLPCPLEVIDEDDGEDAGAA